MKSEQQSRSYSRVCSSDDLINLSLSMSKLNLLIYFILIHQTVACSFYGGSSDDHDEKNLFMERVSSFEVLSSKNTTPSSAHSMLSDMDDGRLDRLEFNPSKPGMPASDLSSTDRMWKPNHRINSRLMVEADHIMLEEGPSEIEEEDVEEQITEEIKSKSLSKQIQRFDGSVKMKKGSVRTNKTALNQGVTNLRVLSDDNIERELMMTSALRSEQKDTPEDQEEHLYGHVDRETHDRPRDVLKYLSSSQGSQAAAVDSPEEPQSHRGEGSQFSQPSLNLGSQKGLFEKNKSKIGFIKEYLSLGKPVRFWPKQGYFRNTYLGGDLAYQEELRSASIRFIKLMKHKRGFAWTPPLDPPVESGMTLSAKLSHSYLDQPQRVVLQIGLKGSDHYGWRRPALNLMIVVDPNFLERVSGVEARHSMLVDTIKPILQRLNVADQVGLSFGKTLLSPRRPELLKEALIQPLKSIMQTQNDGQTWRTTLKHSGDVLNQASADPHRAPGAQALLLLCAHGCLQFRQEIEMVVHRLNLDGTLTSVIDHSMPNKNATYSSQASPLWKIAAAGHGGFWLNKKGFGIEQAIIQEFDRFSRVVARLLRLNIKLGDHVELIEVLGSEMLNQKQKEKVKAREKAMDQRLSTRLGIKADRGEDDDGVQVIIPAFYGGDSHLIHLALWVKKPGEIAEIQLKYKDMVRAKNASYAEQVVIPAIPRTLTLAQHEVLEGANYHLLAAKTLQTLKLQKNFNHLPSLQSHIQAIQQQLNDKELELMSRAQLGRPQPL